MTIQLGIPVARIELMNALQVKACNAYSGLSLPEAPSLFLEFHGSPASVKLQSEAFGDVARDNGGGDFVWSANPEERAKIWKALDEVYLNGSDDPWRHPGNLNVSFSFVEGEAMMMAIKDVAVSSGSACTSASLEPSYVLRALGVDEELAHTSIRFGLSRFNTDEEVDFVADLVIAQVERLRAMSPLYEMHKEGIDLKSIQWAAH